ncbi:CobW family GTP-binding protein [Terasakiella pusilla]|uniref:CobW family GTP-binding protein n=1 Tax=Terasakiella pusilla TaxID=64973 RepID=UPI003AA825FF
MTQHIPISLLTGFLGSGKSTLLSDILQTEEFANTAIIVNEFGDVGLDDFLVVHSEEQIVEMTTGCLCCTIRGDITNTLLSLLEKRENGDIKPFDHVIIETTGLADPAPVLHTLTTHPQLMTQVKLNGTLVTIDALNGEHTLQNHDECVKQLALADKIVITKTDMDLDPAALHDLKQKIKQINSTAPVIEKPTQRQDLPVLFQYQELDTQASRADLAKWLGDDIDHHHDHDHDHHHHDHGHDHGHDHHNHDSHAGDIHTFTIQFEDAISQQAFVLAMQMLLGNQGKNLLRIKGIVHLAEQPERPYVIHGVQHVFHEPAVLESWPDGKRETILVFITRGIPKRSIETYFNTWLNPQSVELLKTVD